MRFKEHRWFQHSSKTSAPLFGGYKPPPRVSSCSQLLAAEARHLGQGSKGKMLRVLFWLNCIELLYNPLTTYTLDLGKSRTFFFSPPLLSTHSPSLGQDFDHLVNNWQDFSVGMTSQSVIDRLQNLWVVSIVPKLWWCWESETPYTKQQLEESLQ